MYRGSDGENDAEHDLLRNATKHGSERWHGIDSLDMVDVKNRNINNQMSKINKYCKTLMWRWMDNM